MKKTPHKLGLVESKREMIFDSMGYLIDTIPCYLDKGVIVKRNPPVLHYLPKPETDVSEGIVKEAIGNPTKHCDSNEDGTNLREADKSSKVINRDSTSPKEISKKQHINFNIKLSKFVNRMKA